MTQPPGTLFPERRVLELLTDSGPKEGREAHRKCKVAEALFSSVGELLVSTPNLVKLESLLVA